jgi:hypothetical protein
LQPALSIPPGYCGMIMPHPVMSLKYGIVARSYPLLPRGHFADRDNVDRPPLHLHVFITALGSATTANPTLNSVKIGKGMPVAVVVLVPW